MPHTLGLVGQIIGCPDGGVEGQANWGQNQA